MLRRLVRLLALAVLLSTATGYVLINTASHDPARWHVDPASARLRGTPNEFLAAPAGTTALRPHLETRVYAQSARTLLAHFDVIARRQPRTEVVAGDLDSLTITYVQRSRIVGFPDYVTVRAVVPEAEGAGSAGLIVWSRSRYGWSDFGVNRTRVEAWLKALEDEG